MVTSSTNKEAARIAAAIRVAVITQSKRANVGHIGSSLSIAEMLGALYAGPLAAQDPTDPNRERFILSKGHAALALYGALWATGRLTDAQLETFCGDGTELVGHPESTLAGIDFSTGSLGQGLPMACGAALAGQLERSGRHAYVLLSDAELNEGSVWEAVMFAAQHQLANLVALVDVNGQQALGYTKDVMDLEPLGERWSSFGWDVHEVDGHDVGMLCRALEASVAMVSARPSVILARTTFGKGVDFMERRIEWHYLPMSDDEYALASQQVIGRSG